MSNLNMPVKFCTDENDNEFSPVVYQESMFNDDGTRMDPVPRKMFAKAYDPTKTYPTESLFCINDNKFYKFTGSGTTTGTFDPTKWTETDDATELTALNSTLSNIVHLSGLRFKNLGTSFTAEQQAKLAAGDFSDFWNGDYWQDTTQNIIWRIVDNTGIARRKGDTNFNEPSLIIMPDDPLFKANGSTTHYMNDTETTAGGYVGTKYRNTYRSQCKTMFTNFFGLNHIASHRELLSNAVTSGKASGWAWTDCDIELPSEVNIYSHNSWSCYTDGGSGYNIGSEWGQFRLFSLAPYMAINRTYNYWLRDVVSDSWFACFDSSGRTSRATANNTEVSIRPFGILV